MRCPGATGGRVRPIGIRIRRIELGQHARDDIMAEMATLEKKLADTKVSEASLVHDARTICMYALLLAVGTHWPCTAALHRRRHPR